MKELAIAGAILWGGGFFLAFVALICAMDDSMDALALAAAWPFVLPVFIWRRLRKFL